MPHIHPDIDFVISAFIVHNNNVLLVHHNKLQKWLPIGGHIELDEDPEQALYREIQEEAGFTAQEIEIVAEKPSFQTTETKFLYTPRFLDIHIISDTHKHIGLNYFVRAKTDRIQLQAEEHADIRWFSEDDLTDPKYGLLPSVLFYSQKAINELRVKS